MAGHTQGLRRHLNPTERAADIFVVENVAIRNLPDFRPTVSCCLGPGAPVGLQCRAILRFGLTVFPELLDAWMWSQDFSLKQMTLRGTSGALGSAHDSARAWWLTHGTANASDGYY